ncbi:MAG TPA: hypothetical protein VHS28_06265 [Chloroflexota bacterium]|nr:hypothetical protein [Chloroflexota bacterium]
MAIGGDGSLYVVDGEAHQLYVLDAKDSIVRSWAVAQSTTFDAPHVAIGSAGEVYVTNPAEGTINIYDGVGNSIGKLGSKGNGDAQFDLPTGIRFDGGGSLWISDTRNHRIQQWTVGRVVSAG